MTTQTLGSKWSRSAGVWAGVSKTPLRPAPRDRGSFTLERGAIAAAGVRGWASAAGGGRWA